MSVPPVRRRISSSDLKRATPLAAARVWEETVESLPSMRTRKSAGLWSRRLRAKSGGTSMPTEARPDTISARSASRDPTNRFTSK